MTDFQLNTGPLDDETKALALKELRETDENVANGIQQLRKLLEGAPPSFLLSFSLSLSLSSLLRVLKYPSVLGRRGHD